MSRLMKLLKKIVIIKIKIIIHENAGDNAIYPPSE